MMTYLTPRCSRLHLPSVWKTTHSFWAWWWRNGCPIMPPTDAYREHEGSRQIVLFRRGKFQVEQVILLPGFQVQPHCHPNVETYECHAFGAGKAWVGGRDLTYKPDTEHPIWARKLLIKAGEYHGGMADEPTMAISFQQWFGDADPTFITDDWEQVDGGRWR